ncbi:hypothetical protein L1S34_12710 [Flavobacterium sp. K77]|uniref:DUF4906 domain-containing protein n=1 Tax=Flavobacterium turcicum TaxID=2764718 RepID=A0ABR7JJ15_9FLAO|nr:MULTISPECIES: hypothetical protein [Flavobacterium]MBC5864159.1 hypothetical protein [Flavobacterium turcicum]MCF6142152.1 hypothetical protein [Flavobacterium sp. K77]NHL03065.1 hypothetical protein [Flavobacterium turcicum]
MKKLIKYLSVVVLSTYLFSCSEGDNPVDFVLENTVNGGGALRTIKVDNPSIALGDANAKFQVTLEVQDKNDGKDTERVDVYVSFVDNSAGNGTNPKAEGLLKSIAAANFTAGTRELPQAVISVTIAELKTKLGLTDAQYTGGDQFVIRLAQVLKDGRVFTRSNSNTNVVGGAYFASPFQYSANVVCPITESLAGTHTYVTTNMKAAGAACGTSVSGTVRFTETATPGVYAISDLSFGMFGSSCYGDNPANSAGSRVTWFCNNLVASGTDQYGDSYTYTITAASGNTITLNWRSTYNDSGTTTLTRQGGANWPAIFTR